MKQRHGIGTPHKRTMVGAAATQWARDATNMPEVISMEKAGTGLDLEVLTPEQEGRYGYVAGTRNAPEKSWESSAAPAACWSRCCPQ